MTIRDAIRQRLGTTEVRASTVSKPVDESKIPERDKELLAKHATDLEKTFEVKDRAKYEIELILSGTLMKGAPIHGMVTVWQRPRHASEGNLSNLYWCPGALSNKSNCMELIPDFGNDSVAHVCPKCGCVWDARSTVSGLQRELTGVKWAHLLDQVFNKAGRCADLTVKVYPRQLRATVAQEMNKNFNGELLSKLDERMIKAVYRFTDILKDMGNGSSFERNALSMLKALGA